jgi:pimeloyl-ACP methyl ester carboxylesterase
MASSPDFLREEATQEAPGTELHGRRMHIISELRYPSRWYTKLLMLILALAFFAVLASSAIAGFLVYRIVKPQRSSTEISMASFPGRPEILNFDVPELGKREGWFFPGRRGAATIVLCHGYESSGGELLTLVSALQDHQYNAFVFDFAAHGKSDGVTTLGFREADELRQAVNALAARNDLDGGRFGFWGYNLGAYAALREAENDKRVRALVLDSVYDQPEQMVKLGVEHNGLGTLPFIVRSTELSFDYLNNGHRHDAPLSSKLLALNGVHTLFIEAQDDPELAAITRRMYLKAPEPREEAVIPHGNFASLSEPEKREYENRVVSFFLLHLPPVGVRATR